MKNFAIVVLFVGGLAFMSACEGRQAADNSARNVADRKDSAVTSGDQSNAQADLDATQKIRQAVVADDSLSTNAQNVKIITSKGVVTLRGPVANAEEKANIARIAQNVAGVTRVDNQLEITN